MKRIPFDENHEFVRGTKWEVEGKSISLIYRRIHL
jgi:DNA (cytosine-5)-methyltransferase 1